ncbi:MAG TPA: stage V sporulation protein AA [Bacillota bacterium]|nr:stage V sporulation protein AA [Bacillota bacterium]
MNHIVYLRLKKYLAIQKRRPIQLRDIAHLSTSSNHKSALENEMLYRMRKEDQELLIIDGFLVIEHLNDFYPDLEFQLIGPSHTTIRVEGQTRHTPILLVCFVWILLFIGTAMAIMNFHYDVSMEEVQIRLHYLFTGEQTDHPLWIQIPYSLGLGMGMLLFFNHWFQKRFNEEPSPLEVEVFNYQQDIDNYVYHKENRYSDEPFE